MTKIIYASESVTLTTIFYIIALKIMDKTKHICQRS